MLVNHIGGWIGIGRGGLPRRESTCDKYPLHVDPFIGVLCFFAVFVACRVLRWFRCVWHVELVSLHMMT